jgi:hypothetical protein
MVVPQQWLSVVKMQLPAFPVTRKAVRLPFFCFFCTRRQNSFAARIGSSLTNHGNDKDTKDETVKIKT